MLLRVVDFETTGIPSDNDRQAVCEVGWCDVRNGAIGDQVGMLVNPGRPIPPEAMAVHHIRDHEVAEAPAIEVGFRHLMAGQPHAFVAHNAAFEREFFSGGDIPWICTLKVARRLWPDAPSHTNSVLRYWLGLNLDDDRAMPPHRASPDAYVTAHILVRALALASIDDMIDWTAKPSLLPRITFGKHRGTLWQDAQRDYLEWIVRQADMDRDVKFTARHHLNQRGKGGAR